MSDSDTKAILDNLMARRGNSPEFILELEGYRDDMANGELDGADKKYLRDLAKRLSGVKGGDAMDPIEAPEDDEIDGDSRFARAKAAFHARFNPDEIDPDAPDAAIRRQVYEEFRAELEAIEDEG